MEDFSTDLSGSFAPDPYGTAQITPLETGRIALLDADYIKYVVPYSKWKHHRATGEWLNIEKFIKDWISGWLTYISDPIVFCFSGKSSETFRAFISFEKEYKGNRKNVEDPYDYPGKIDDMYQCVDYIQKKFVSLIFKDLEADDIVAALQDREHTYIVSKDKDLKQIPGFHYDFEKNNIYEIDNERAIYNLAYQLMAGDSTDNIKGMPGMGEKRTMAFLEPLKPKQYINSVLREYQKKFGLFKGTDMFVETWNLVKVRENRGEHFISKYKRMFDTKEMIVNENRRRKIEAEKNS